MRKPFKNPPLLEAVCDFSFEEDGYWNQTIPGLYYSKVQGDFPDRREVPVGVKLVFNPKAGSNITPTPPRVQFLKKEKGTLIQLSPYRLSINQLKKDYNSWKEFLVFILNSFSIYNSLLPKSSLVSIQLRYLNHIHIPLESEIDLKDYFCVYPEIDTLNMGAGAFSMQLLFPQNEENEVLEVKLNSFHPNLPQPQKGLFFHLDLQYRILKAGESSHDLEITLTRIHDRIEDVFLSSLTSRLKAMFDKENQV